MPLDAGRPAPDFALDSTTGRTMALQDLRGKKVVLYFYPKDDTPGCTKEACNFRDSFADFEHAGAIILGVSPDDVSSHHDFKNKFNLPFPLLADPDHKIAEAYDVWKEKSMYGKKYMGIERTTYVIDTTGKIATVFPKVKVDEHHTEVLAAIKAAG
jgi:peroxiredoxin Q/BCP